MLIVLSMLLAVWAVWICRQSSPSHTDTLPSASLAKDSTPSQQPTDIITTPATAITSADSVNNTRSTAAYAPDNAVSHSSASARVASTRINDADVRHMTGNHPFSAEARKVLSGDLQETDSMSRHRILSYCEHLRTSYTTRDIDFLRQVFSDNALIIVGHTVSTSDAATPKGTPRVTYSIRSKREYLERLAKIFDSGKEIDLQFSGFHIMRHPTMEGIYGVTLRQRYACGEYSDDGWLFLLWDFRNPSMPLIHVRTWQPTRSLSGEDDIIDMSDFNLE